MILSYFEMLYFTAFKVLTVGNDDTGVNREPFMLPIIPEAIIDGISFVHGFHMVVVMGICNKLLDTFVLTIY